MSVIIGIDLGTTFSAVGFVRDGAPVILPNGVERIVPSVVGFTPEGQLVVGTPALNQYVLYPENTVRSIKRLMGTDATVHLNDRDYMAAEVSAIILREMKRIAEANLGEPVDRAVITVPAYFSDAARVATREAGEIAGFTVERIINEPTAASLAYGLTSLDERQMIAVYDLGGGTFDVSIVECDGGVLEVRASHGDVHLGGDDFDELLLNYLAEAFITAHGVDPREDRKAHARLLRAAEQAKIALSGQPFVRVREEYLLEKDGKPLHFDIEVARTTFNDLIEDRLSGTLLAFDRALEDAGLKFSDLDRVLFVGGSTRIPFVWQLVAAHTGIEPTSAINPDEAVALGAGVQAAIIAGEPMDAILVDVTPHSLGIAVAEPLLDTIVTDRFSVLVHRNTTLPTSRSEVYHTMFPEQTGIEIKVYQGEQRVASRNTLLGEFLFENLKPESPGERSRITVQFDIDVNGILTVSAIDRGSKAVKQTTLRSAHTRLSPAAKEASARFLAALEPASAEGADPMIERARRLVANQLNDMTQLNEILTALAEAQSEGREEDVDTLTEQMVDLLYELENRPEDDDLLEIVPGDGDDTDDESDDDDDVEGYDIDGDEADAENIDEDTDTMEDQEEIEIEQSEDDDDGVKDAADDEGSMP